MLIASYTSSQSFLAIPWVSAPVTVINTNPQSAALRRVRQPHAKKLPRSQLPLESSDMTSPVKRVECIRLERARHRVRCQASCAHSHSASGLGMRLTKTFKKAAQISKQTVPDLSS